MHRLFHPPVALGTLHDRLESARRHQRDEIHSAHDLELEEATGFLRTPTGPHRLKTPARRLLAQRLRIPDSYLGRCPHPLAAANVNHFLHRSPSRRFLLRFQGDEVRAVLSDRYQAVDHPELTRRLLEVVPESTPVRYELSATLMVVQLLPAESQHATRGRELFGGITVTNSETGAAVVGLSAMVYRVICLNGLVLGGGASGLRRRHTRDAAETLREFQRRAREAWSDAGDSPDRFQTMRRIRVPQPEAALKRLEERHQLTAELAKEVESAFAVEPGDTMFDLINAFTRAGNAPTLPLEDRAKLQELGGRILDGAERGRWLH
jgi:hypothetical protein